MIKLVLVIMTGLAILNIYELVRRKLHFSNENSRKVYHVVHALIIGFAPFLVSYQVIILLELVMIGIMFLVRTFKLMPWLYNVGRLSWGEYFGAVAVVIAALMAPNHWVFLAAMLHLGVSDALAALIGTRYGKDTQFRVFGQTKSLHGSGAFLLSSIIITTVVIIVSQSGISGLLILAILPILATLTETSSPYGIDNLTIPLVVIMVLNSLRFAT